MSYTLLIVTRDQEEFEAKVRERDLSDLNIIAPQHRDQIAEYIPSADIILGIPKFVQPHLPQASKLQWLQSVFAGVEVLTESGQRSDYLLTNVKETYGRIMAEYVFGYILNLEKEVFGYLDMQLKKRWVQKPFHSIGGKTIAIIGAGSIGQEIAQLAKAFQLQTLGLRTSGSPAEYFDQIFTWENAEECFSQADYIVSVLPKTAETNDIINEEIFSYCKTDAVFFNIGRGNAVSESALIKALEEKRLKAAILDVFKEEPLPAESPLWETPNLFVTPHVSGYTNSERIFDIFEDNYRRFLNGQELLYKIDFEKGY